MHSCLAVDDLLFAQYPRVHGGANDATALDDDVELFVRELALPWSVGAAVLMGGQQWSSVELDCFPEALIGYVGQVQEHAAAFHLPQEFGGRRLESTFGAGAMRVHAGSVVGEADDIDAVVPPSALELAR